MEQRSREYEYQQRQQHPTTLWTFVFLSEEEWGRARSGPKAPVLRLTRGGYRKHPYGRYWSCSRYAASGFQTLSIFFYAPYQLSWLLFSLLFSFFPHCLSSSLVKIGDWLHERETQTLTLYSALCRERDNYHRGSLALRSEGCFETFFCLDSLFAKSVCL